MRHIESQIQMACVTWFRIQYPRIAKLLFAVPNGGARNAREAGIMKGEGVTAGVSDLILLVPSMEYHSLCIEFKTEKGRQSDNQVTWQRLAEHVGNKYVIVRSLDQFIDEINAYLKAM